MSSQCRSYWPASQEASGCFCGTWKCSGEKEFRRAEDRGRVTVAAECVDPHHGGWRKSGKELKGCKEVEELAKAAAEALVALEAPT